MLNLPTNRSTIVLSPLSPVEVCMPLYEFFCRDCKKAFSKALTIAEHGKEGISCPYCSSKNLEQRWSAFSVITSKKSA